MSEQEGHVPGPGQSAPMQEAASLSRGDAEASSRNRPEALRWYHRLLRRAAHRWFWLTRGMTLGVRAAVIDDCGRVFLVRHSYIPGWHLPGGGVERGQHLRAALEMELSEEGNILLEGAPVLFAVYHNRIVAPRDHVALFVVRHFRQTGSRLRDREIVEAGFFPPDALPDGTTPATRRRLAEITEGRVPDPHW